MQRLLSVDWDYFLPVPLYPSEPEAALYDWVHSPDPLLSSDLAWQIRGGLFVAAGVPLPRCQLWRGFASRFTFCPGARLYVVEHHAMAMKLVTEAWDSGERILEITSYDLHHDCGYTYEPHLANMEAYVVVNSENWLAVAAKLFDIRVDVYYPQWAQMNWEDPPQVPPAGLAVDHGATDPIPYDGLVISHSGAWVPPWCDQDYIRFLRTWPDSLTREVLEPGADQARPWHARPWEPPPTVDTNGQVQLITNTHS